MDGESVTDEPSEEESQPLTLTKMFRDIFPMYLSMGMSYDEFWNGPVWLAKSYREAYETRLRNEEWARHRQGAYIYHAILCAAPVIKPFVKDAKPGKYPDEPWPLTQQEADERERQREIAGYEKALAQRRAEIEARKQKEAMKDG